MKKKNTYYLLFWTLSTRAKYERFRKSPDHQPFHVRLRVCQVKLIQTPDQLSDEKFVHTVYAQRLIMNLNEILHSFILQWQHNHDNKQQMC